MAGGDSSGHAGKHEGCSQEATEPGEQAPAPGAEVAQDSALAPRALGSHAALLYPVALRCPVALPTVSNPEEVTQGRGLPSN